MLQWAKAGGAGPAAFDMLALRPPFPSGGQLCLSSARKMAGVQIRSSGWTFKPWCGGACSPLLQMCSMHGCYLN